MRVLFLTAPALGHYGPMEPLAAAAAARGHAVAFATAVELQPEVEAAGLRCFPLPWTNPHEAKQQAARRSGTAEPARHLFWEALVAGGGETADALVELIEAWGAELVVHDRQGFAAPLAAKVTGILSAHVSLGVLWASWVAELEHHVAPLWRRRGFDPVPRAGLDRYLYLDYCPPGLQRPEIAEVAVAHRVRHPVLEWRAPRPGADRFTPPPSDRPTVYVTLGTSYNARPAFFSNVIEALGGDFNVVATLGDTDDVASTDPFPPDVVVAPWLHHDLVLPYCVGVVCHAGSGTVFGALAHGLPLVLYPSGADQFLNTEQCTTAGVGLRLRDYAAPGEVRALVKQIHGQPRYRTNAMRLASEIAGMAPLETAVDLLEELVKRRQPMLSR